MLKHSRQIPKIANKFVLLTVSDYKFAAVALTLYSVRKQNQTFNKQVKKKK